MTHRREIVVTMVLLAAAAGALASAVEPRQATPLADDARYTVIAGTEHTTYRELRLDRVTGQTWQFDRHDEAWRTVPCEDHEPPRTGTVPRFQIVISDRSFWLVDTLSGQTWRWDRRPRVPGRRYTWSLAGDDADIEGWHLVR